MMRFLKARHLTGVAPALTGVVGLLNLSSCASAPPSLPTAAKVESTAPAKLAGPARYFLTEGFGATFDEGELAAPVPRREYAIASGRRIQLDGGAIVGEGRSPAGLVGFRSLPADMGGGYLVWSDLRSYYTKDFLGDLTPIADIAPTAGTRRWFSSILFRTPRGILSLDPKTRALSRWRGSPGVVDMLAIDDKRGVTLDLTGRVRVTFDGGVTWTDFTASKGFLSNAARLGKKGEIELLSLLGAAEYRIVPGAAAVEQIPPPLPFNRRYNGYGSSPYQYVLPSNMSEDKPIEGVSRRLASESFGWAVAVGIGIPGDRALVASGFSGENGLSMVSIKTGVEITSIPVLGVGSPYYNCQPFRTSRDLLLACAHTEGANVLLIKDDVATPKLEATFPDVASFFGDDQGHVAYSGRCGRTPPSIDDFGSARSPDQPYMGEDYGYSPYGPYGYDPDYEEPVGTSDAERAKPASNEKHICVRLDGGQWIEHRLTGDDAKDLYRWVLGKDGAVTALLIEGANPEATEPSEEPPPEEPGDEEDESLRRKRSEAPAGHSTGLFASPTNQPSAPPKPPKAAASAQPKAAPKPAKSASPKAAPSTLPSAKPSADPKAVKVEKPRELLRVVRIDPKDRGARHGKWAQVLTPLDQAPWRSVDSNFWTEDDGSLRGWIRLPEETQDGRGHEEESPGDTGEGGAESPIATEFSGRFAGVRVSTEGKVTTFSLPAHTKNVIFGGRFAMARAENDSGDLVTYHETTDGGATWTEVEGPPVGDIDEQYDGSRAPSCSALGCALNYGVVRVGWTSPKPGGKKRDRESTDSGLDLFPMPRLPKLECKFEGEPETFPLPAPKPKAEPKPTPPSNADRMEEMERRIREALAESGGTLPPDMFPPGMIPSGLPIAPPAPSASPKKAPVKPGKPVTPPKPPPPPPAEIVSIRTKPQSPLGQIQDKNWVVDFLVPFDPQASVKHASTGTNGLERLQGSVTPVVGFSGAELLLTFDKRRTTVGGAAPNILQFEYNGRFVSAASLAVTGSAVGKGTPVNIAALDEERRVVVLFTGDAGRPVLRMAKVPDPARGKLAIARRVDAPGAALIWYSTTTGEVLAAPVDFGKAEVGAFSPLASIATLADGGLPVCAPKTPVKGPVYQLIMELGMPVSVSAQSGKSLYNGGDVPSSLLVTAHSERICVSAVEVRGNGNSLDLTASFGPKAAAVSRSKTTALDPTQLAVQKLSCLLKEPESR